MKKKLTENQRDGFQRQMPKRVRARDTENVLERFHVEYMYHQNLNFGILFKNPNRSPIAEAWREAKDNAGDRPCLLIVSRPHDNIYVVCRSGLWWFNDCVSPILYLDSVDIAITRLEDFLKGVPSDLGSN